MGAPRRLENGPLVDYGYEDNVLLMAVVHAPASLEPRGKAELQANVKWLACHEICIYDAKTSPHMFVINPQGILIYDGAIDDKPTTDLDDVPTATNHVCLALEEAMACRQVTTPVTRPYGCSVKYGH